MTLRAAPGRPGGYPPCLEGMLRLLKGVLRLVLRTGLGRSPHKATDMTLIRYHSLTKHAIKFLLDAYHEVYLIKYILP